MENLRKFLSKISFPVEITLITQEELSFFSLDHKIQEGPYQVGFWEEISLLFLPWEIAEDPKKFQRFLQEFPVYYLIFLQKGKRNLLWGKKIFCRYFPSWEYKEEIFLPLKEVLEDLSLCYLGIEYIREEFLEDPLKKVLHAIDKEEISMEDASDKGFSP